MMRISILSTVLLLPSLAFGEVACSDSKCFNPDDGQTVSAPIETELRIISDEYLAVLRSESFEEATNFWTSDSFGQSQASPRLENLRKTIGFYPDHVATNFRRTFSVPEANGKAGYFVVTEYGTRARTFDVIQQIVWVVENGQWQIVCHGYVLRCPPDSRPVELSPNNALHLQTTPVTLLASARTAPYAGFKLA